jgi:hypothetical protein
MRGLSSLGDLGAEVSYNPFTRTVTEYTIHVSAHRIEPRFDIPASEHRVHARDRRAAIRETVYAVATEAGVPGWRPWLREIATHLTVEATAQHDVAA